VPWRAGRSRDGARHARASASLSWYRAVARRAPRPHGSTAAGHSGVHDPDIAEFLNFGVTTTQEGSQAMNTILRRSRARLSAVPRESESQLSSANVIKIPRKRMSHLAEWNVEPLP